MFIDWLFKASLGGPDTLIRKEHTMDEKLEWIGKYNGLANNMAELWKAMPAVVDDDFPEAKFNFEGAVKAFYDHALIIKSEEEE